MREIKFRGVATVNDKYNGIKVGDFVYGSFVETNIDCQILFGDGEQISVDRKTVGQYTGRKDKNGVEIYEDDILLVDNDDEHYKSEVYFDGGALCIDVVGCDFDFTAVGWALGCSTNIHGLEVIGNSHQNQELPDNA